MDEEEEMMDCADVNEQEGVANEVLSNKGSDICFSDRLERTRGGIANMKPSTPHQSSKPDISKEVLAIVEGNLEGSKQSGEQLKMRRLKLIIECVK